jgi:aminotransferase
MDSEEFAVRLLNEYGVACVPGTAFGACGEGFVRMSYATSLEKIVKAMERLTAMLRKTLRPNFAQMNAE